MRSTFYRSARLQAFLATVLVVCGLEATPVKHSKRVINEQTVDLTLLFRWWTNQNGPRPLRSWAHLTGSVVRTNSLGWELKAQSDGPHQPASNNKQHQGTETEKHILLKNPPAFEKGEFERLAGQLAALKEKRSQLTHQQAQAKSQAATEAHSGEPVRVRNLKTRQARAVETEAGRELKAVNASITELTKKLAGYPNTEHYVVDCFAFDSGQEFRGMPVYDYGTVLIK